MLVGYITGRAAWPRTPGLSVRRTRPSLALPEVAVIVCMCHAISDRELARVIADGAATLEEVGRACRAGTDCGCCREMIRVLLERSAPDRRTRHAADRPGAGAQAQDME